MFDLIGSIIKEAIVSEATEHDRRVAGEYDAANKAAVEKNKNRNSAITGAAGIAALGAVALYGINKLSGDGKNQNQKLVKNSR